MAADQTDAAIAIGFRLLAARLRGLREEAGLSLRQLAEASEVSYDSLRSVETSRRMPTLATLYRVGLVLGVTPRDLLADLYPWDGGAPPAK